MALEDDPGGDSFVTVFPLQLRSRPFSLWQEVLLRQTRKPTEGLELEWRTVYSDEIMLFCGGRIPFTKGCLISSPSRMNPKEQALGLISFAMAAGDDRGMRWTSAWKGQQHEYETTEYGTLTFALPFLPRATAPVHINRLYALLLHENACYERIDTICLNTSCTTIQLLLDVPASQFSSSEH
jgi:hypothetical protein